MNRPVRTPIGVRIWKAQLRAAYVVAGFSVLGLLGAAETHSRLEADVSVIVLGFSGLWALVAHFMIQRRHG